VHGWTHFPRQITILSPLAVQGKIVPLSLSVAFVEAGRASPDRALHSPDL
jgi:hypothetical protein